MGWEEGYEGYDCNHAILCADSKLAFEYLESL